MQPWKLTIPLDRGDEQIPTGDKGIDIEQLVIYFDLFRVSPPISIISFLMLLTTLQRILSEQDRFSATQRF